MTRHVVTASATADGGPLYLQRDGKWTRQISNAALLDDEEERARMLASAKCDEFTVCDPYLIVVSTPDRRPVSFKERIRATGPTTHYGS
jgi:hypothetical protein